MAGKETDNIWECWNRVKRVWRQLLHCTSSLSSFDNSSIYPCWSSSFCPFPALSSDNMDIMLWVTDIDHKVPECKSPSRWKEYVPQDVPGYIGHGSGWGRWTARHKDWYPNSFVNIWSHIWGLILSDSEFLASMCVDRPNIFKLILSRTIPTTLPTIPYPRTTLPQHSQPQGHPSPMDPSPLYFHHHDTLSLHHYLLLSCYFVISCFLISLILPCTHCPSPNYLVHLS